MLPADQLFDTRLSQDVWKDKYSNQGKDATIQDTMFRVAWAVVSQRSPDRSDVEVSEDVGRICTAMQKGILMPAGRIVAGAGTGNRVTLMNCYVMGTVPDSLDGIFDELKRSALTMQQGGGIGTDFSTLRPEGALLKRTGSYSSGPLTFMDTWDAMCRTIMSAGHRRGAMMGTMRIDHPDIRKFITAKRTKGRMTNFNISVLVTDNFLKELERDGIWHLKFPIPKQEWSSAELNSRRYKEVDGKETFIYEAIGARKLWEEITRNTYEYSEPGVIFIDRINSENNLQYLETISCTNPCGEQPLPPYGACDLGHINLAMLVEHPFTPEARIDKVRLANAARDMVMFLDNVIDVTGYPLEEQEKEQKHKRRIGVGITGLADALCAMRIRYGSNEAVMTAGNLMRTIANACYYESAKIAASKGPFPGWNPNQFNMQFLNRLDEAVNDEVDANGLRNGVLLTVAPTGTMSSFYGNTSGGCEPIFRHRTQRKVRQPDDSFKSYNEYSLTVRAFAHKNGLSAEEAYAFIEGYPQDGLYPTAENLTVEDHVRMQAACQQWVDASISKTVNIPKDMPYDEFKKVYNLAYTSGCKGCTTYRENPAVRESILSDAEQISPKPTTESPRESAAPGPNQARTEARTLGERQQASFVSPVQVHTPQSGRPYKLAGMTYKIKWPHYQSAVYVTINEDETGQPREIFIASKNAHFAEWSTALSVMISRQLKEGADPREIASELKQITLAQEPAWIDGVLYRSVIAMIGHVLEDYVSGDPLYETDSGSEPVPMQSVPGEDTAWVKHCPKCGAVPLIYKEGCEECLSCGYNKCS